MAASGAQKCPKSEKLDEAQALAKSCAGRPDFLPCDGLSNCATHSHGKCFKLHWCCHLGWCHCKFSPEPQRCLTAKIARNQAVVAAAPRPRKDHSRTVRFKKKKIVLFFLCAPTFRTCLDLLPQVVVFHF